MMRRLVIALAFTLIPILSLAAPAPVLLLNAVTTTSATPPITACPNNPAAPVNRPFPFQAFQAVETGTGAITATIQIQSSNDGSTWTNYGPALSLSGTTSTSVTAFASAPFDCFGAIVTAISGTGAAITLKMDVGP